VFSLPEGQIVIACAGDTMWYPSASAADSYTVTARSTADGGFDVVFSKGTTTSEYIYKCRDGTPIGGIQERP
jgi:hypothetical protein